MLKDRALYIPAGSVPVTREGVEAVAYIYDSKKGLPSAALFGGKRSKPDHHYLFSNTESRNKYIENYFDSVEVSYKAKKERALEAKNRKLEAAKSLKVGDIYYESWGYDQTNIDFHIIVDVKGQSVLLQKIGSNLVESNPPQDLVTPNPSHKIGDPIRKRLNNYGGFTMSSYSDATKYEGRPLYETTAGWGH